MEQKKLLFKKANDPHFYQIAYFYHGRLVDIQYNYAGSAGEFVGYNTTHNGVDESILIKIMGSQGYVLQRFPEKIDKGALIEIETHERSIYNGRVLMGEVISAINYGSIEKPEWYIEIRDRDYGYIYIHQNYTNEALVSISVYENTDKTTLTEQDAENKIKYALSRDGYDLDHIEKIVISGKIGYAILATGSWVKYRLDDLSMITKGE